MLVLILAISLLTACSDSNAPPASDNGDDGGNPKETAANAAQEPVTVGYDQVIYDDNGMKVTLTGYKREPASSYSSGAFYWFFTVENHTDKEINTSFIRSSVNGCMLEFGNDLIKTQAGETKESKSQFWLGVDDLNARSITAIENFEFTLSFAENDGSKWIKYAASEPITLPAPEPLDYGFSSKTTEAQMCKSCRPSTALTEAI